MAAAPASCAPCAFGAVSSSLLSFPYQIVGTTQVSVIPHLTAFNGTTVTSFQTITVTETGTGALTPGNPTSGPTATLSQADLTWTTLGTTLTYPNTYVEYLAFAGAAVSSGGPSACAQTLPPTPLSLPASTVAASFIYNIADTGTIPSGLLSYLDSAGLPAQLAGDQLESCAPLGAAGPASAPASTVTPSSTGTLAPTSSASLSTQAISTSFSTFTSTATVPTTTLISTSTSILVPSSTTVTTNLPPPTTLSGPTTATAPISETVVTSAPVVTTGTVSHTPAIIFSTVTGAPIVTQASNLPTPFGLSLGSSATSVPVSGLLSLLNSLARTSSTLSATPGYANATSRNGSLVVGPVTATVTSGNATRATTYLSTSVANYTGAAHIALPPAGLGLMEGLLALAVPIFL